MDGETNGLSDWFLARHTTDPSILFRLLSNRNRENSTSNRQTGRFTEGNAEPAVNSVTALPTRIRTSSGPTALTRNFRTNLIAATDNSQPTLELQRVPDFDTAGRIQGQPCSANSSDTQLDSTAESLRVPLPQAPLPPCMSDYIVESVESTNNSTRATEQGVARATASMYRAMERRAEREQQLNQ